VSALEAKSWPFEQARALLQRVEGQPLVTFQTGFGPSGAPHIGTFGEVVRTNMVRCAFEELTEGKVETRLIVFSDDYDGFRRVPDGMPASMSEDIGLPLTRVCDPFGEFSSFAARNNIALRHFLDRMEVGYEFVSSTEIYAGGGFNEALKLIYDHYDAVMKIMLPSLGGQGGNRAETYSPFMPLSPNTGKVLDNANVCLLGDYEITFTDEDGSIHQTSIFGGQVKLQWKVDWAMRWMAFNIDYEMHGKDLIDSAVLSTRICKAVGRKAPLTYFYELFLDDEGRKLSKSLGNGMTTETWNRYSASGPLAQFMFMSPRSAKAFTPSVIPRVTDEYLKALTAFPALEGKARLDSPVWHVHEGSPPPYNADVSYSLLINLATVSGAQDAETLMNYLDQYKSLSVGDRAFIGSLVPGVIAYVREHVERKPRRPPTEYEARAFSELADTLENLSDELDGEGYQWHVYEIGKSFMFEPLRDWFKAIYEVYFGDEQGPRFGSFIAAYGRERSIELLRSVL
jgi:lysyl-tRNA synthetase class 1